MANIADFEPFVLQYAQYVPSEILQHNIRESVNAFMRETKIARDYLEFDTQEKVHDYILEVGDCRRLLKVHKVEIAEVHRSGREHWSELRAGDEGDYTVELRMGNYPIIVFREEYKKPRKVKVYYSWSIARDDCDVPDYIYEDFMDAIVSGTLTRLAYIPNNSELMSVLDYHTRRWFEIVQQVKIERTGGKAKRIIGAPILSGRRRGSLWR